MYNPNSVADIKYEYDSRNFIKQADLKRLTDPLKQSMEYEKTHSRFNEKIGVSAIPSQLYHRNVENFNDEMQEMWKNSISKKLDEFAIDLLNLFHGVFGKNKDLSSEAQLKLTEMIDEWRRMNIALDNLQAKHKVHRELNWVCHKQNDALFIRNVIPIMEENARGEIRVLLRSLDDESIAKYEALMPTYGDTLTGRALRRAYQVIEAGDSDACQYQKNLNNFGWKLVIVLTAPIEDTAQLLQSQVPAIVEEAELLRGKIAQIEPAFNSISLFVSPFAMSTLTTEMRRTERALDELRVVPHDEQ